MPTIAGPSSGALASPLERAQYALKPASTEEFGVEIDRLFRFARTFGIRPESVEDMTAFYRQALDDMPADLIREAVDDVIRKWKWGKKMPLPADLRERAQAELGERRRELTIARRDSQPQDKPLTPAERGTPEQRAAYVRAVKAGLQPISFDDAIAKLAAADSSSPMAAE